jgi:hypothetical protein
MGPDRTVTMKAPVHERPNTRLEWPFAPGHSLDART